MYNLAKIYGEKLYSFFEVMLEDTNLMQKFFLNYGMTLLMLNGYDKLENISFKKQIFSLPNHVGEMFLLIALFKKIKYDEILEINNNLKIDKDNNFTKIIKFIISIINNDKFKIDINELNDNLILIYKKLIEK